MRLCMNYWFGLIACLILAPVLSAEPLGKTLLARGEVTAERNGANTALKRLSPVFRQDTLRSGNNARAQFRMIDDAYINLQQNTVLRLENYQLNPGTQEGNVLLELISGGLRTVTGAIGKKDKKDYQLKTPVATIGIRGTLYEVEIIPSGMYVAAWQGQIWIRSYSGRCDLTLGEGQAFRFAVVNRVGECQTLRAVPQLFSDGHSSSPAAAANVITGQSTLPEIEPLLANPQREPLQFAAILSGLNDNALLTGRASSISQSEALLQEGNNLVTNTDAVFGFAQNIGGYALSWGRWNSYEIQDELTGNSTQPDDANGLIWLAYQPTDPASVMTRQGSVRYDTITDSLTQSSLGAVTNLAVQMDVNFDDGAVTNGAIAADVPGFTWAGVFDGGVQNGALSLQFNGGSLINAQTGNFTDVSGQISGGFVGNTAEAIAGGFSLLDETDTANQIEGVFLVE